MTERALVIKCQGESLVGILHAPAREPSGLGVLVVVGGPQYRVGSHRQFVLMARRFAAAGHAVLRFDYRGMGDSTGAARSFEAVDEDIRAAVDAFLAELPDLRGVAVFGLCDAASATLMYCGTDPRIRAVVLANPWVRTVVGEARTQVRHYYGNRLMTRAFWGKLFSGRLQLRESLVGLLGAVRLSRGTMNGPGGATAPHFVDRMLEGLGRTDCAVLLLMSERDLTAREFDELCRVSLGWSSQMAQPRVRRVDLPGADPTFSSAEALEAATRAVVDWLAERPADARN